MGLLSKRYVIDCVIRKSNSAEIKKVCNQKSDILCKGAYAQLELRVGVKGRN